VAAPGRAWHRQAFEGLSLVTNLDQSHATTLLVYSLSATATGGTAVATVAPLHLRLMTSNGTATSYGTELPTGGSYVAGTGITPVTGTLTANSFANSIALTQVNMPSCTIVGGELWDSSGTPHRLWQGALSANRTVNSGDTFTVPIGSLVIGLG
jgi:hypothetical protein